jgi:nucleotide-binding universal stress UspA family protein
MKYLKKILFPTDFSPMSKHAFLYALKLAKKFNAKLKVINIYRADFGVPVPETVAYQMLEARKEEAQKELSLFVKLDSNSPYADVPLEYCVDMGFASDVIIDYSKNKEEEIDMIVMGTKGEHNLADKIFGSVTSNVIRDAKCPVLAIPEGTHDIEIRDIAYATDLKSDTVESLKEVAEIAAFFGANLHCICIDTEGNDFTPELRKFNDLISKLDLDMKIAELSSDTIAHGLDQYVHENGIDMVLMLRSHRNFFERIFLRSITTQVALHSTAPLLVFKK